MVQCFNSVAILFLLSFDDLMFSIGLNERARSRVEGDGRVHLDDNEAHILSRLKATHTTVFTAGILLAVLIGGRNGPESSGAMVYSFAAVWLCALDEAIARGGGVGVVAKAAAVAAAYCLLGSCAFFMLFFSVFFFD